MNSETPIKTRLVILIGNQKPFLWAKNIGLSAATFDRVWNKGGQLKLAQLELIYRKTGVSLNWLIAGEGPMFPGSSPDIQTAENPRIQDEQALPYGSALPEPRMRPEWPSSGDISHAPPDIQQKVEELLSERMRTEGCAPVAVSIPVSIRPVVEAVVDVMRSDDNDAIVSLALNAYTFQGRVRYKSEVEQLKREVEEQRKEGEDLKREVIQLKSDMDAIVRRLLEPREADFKSEGTHGKKASEGGQDGS